MEIACGVLALTLVLLAGALLGATRRRKESSELVEELRSLFQPRPLIERARIGRDASLPGYAISLKLGNHAAVPMDLIEAYAISRFNDGEECGTRWYPTKKRLRSLEPGRTTTIRFAIESRKAQRIKWPSSVKIAVRIRRGLQDHLETLVDVRSGGSHGHNGMAYSRSSLSWFGNASVHRELPSLDGPPAPP